MSDRKYNGWTNYETWNLKLWIDNDQGSYEYWREQARSAWDETDEDAEDRSLDARIDLAKRLESETEDEIPEVVGFYADVLRAAVSEVNWYEIADAMLSDEEIEGYESNEKAGQYA